MSKMLVRVLRFVAAVGFGASLGGIILAPAAWTGLAGAAEAAPAPAEVPDKPAGTLLLDEGSYWRFYLQGGPARINYQAMTTEGDKSLNDKWLERTKEQVLKSLKATGQATDDWRRELVYRSGYANLNLFNAGPSSPPPEGWTSPSFDDRDWSRCQRPFKMAKLTYTDGTVDHYLQINRQLKNLQ